MQRAPLPAPRFGEHNDYVLADLLGLTDVEIRQLRESGAVADAPAQSPSEATVR
jgi:crotonobetainyl-CoA:carnitine CoA-transferase CaiB-like acyl-CoA transferase